MKAGQTLPVRETAGGISFTVHVQPRAARNELCGIQGDALKLRLTSPPVEGAANRQCIDLLAQLLKVPRRDITILTGETSRHKTVRIAGITPEQVHELIAATAR